MKLITLIFVLFLSACTGSSDNNEDTLRKAGYTEIRMGGYPWFGGCSDSE